MISAARPMILTTFVAGRIGASTSALLRTAPCARPSSPCGRMISTTAMTMNSRHQRQLGKIDAEVADMDDADADADGLDLGNENGREISAGDRARAADHNDDEGVADHA